MRIDLAFLAEDFHGGFQRLDGHSLALVCFALEVRDRSGHADPDRQRGQELRHVDEGEHHAILSTCFSTAFRSAFFRQ
ncbi:hypothetical protein [Sinorhizobium meliloti]|uniref:hypothetical protein n=1 Tax=Rhizobium meliloti TaxID=382 RepID=UPI0013E2C314|nr:hypothetical protein [Sinorhizobium meliloti]MDW9668052.1 hypothetical protein [Sinorhizobium meliloti]MDW9740876.1 hypothetical protein [Sinorhizobium meliloti]